MIRLKTLLVEVASGNGITKENLANAKQIVNGLLKRGFSSTEAISLAGNMSVESMNVSTSKWFDTSISDGTAYGLMQWQSDRLTALKAFAKYKGTGISSLSTQLDFAKFELKDCYLLYPTDKTKKLKQQLIPGIPVGLVYIVDEKGKPSIPRHFTPARTEVMDFNRSITGTVGDTAAKLCDNVFRPTGQYAHKDWRVENAIAISNYITNGVVPKDNSSKTTKTKANDDTKSVTSKIYTIKPGETLGGIANKNNTTVDNIIKKNPGLKPTKLQIGQKIKI